MFKKSAIAGILLASLAGAAHAQTVSTYGLIDTSIQSNNQGSGSHTRTYDGGWSSSFLGFRGSEELGGGLKVNFQLEAGLFPSNGRAGHSTAVTNEIFSREAWVGFSGSLGEIRLGRSDMTIAHDLDIRNSQFGQFGMHGANRLAIAGGSDLKNVIRYISPSVGGFNLYLGHATGNDNTAISDAQASQNSAALEYNQGSLRVNIGAWQQDATTSVAKRDMIGVGASYNFGLFSAGIAHDRGDNSTTANVTSRITTAGIAVPLSMGVKAHAVYSISTDGAQTTANEGRGYTLGLSKDLSKRTKLYAAYTATGNQTNSYMAMQGQTTPTSGGTDLKTVTAGIRHTF